MRTAPMLASGLLRVEVLGTIPYGPMLSLQRERHEEVAQGTAEETLFLLEHEPVVTLGRHAREAHVLVGSSGLARRNIALFRVDRGGDVTYHGPGQLLGYPILRLRGSERDVRGYVWRLEEILLRTAADFGIKASRCAGLPGIWVGEAKLGAVGVRIAGWVTLHGFSLNLAPDLQGFALIVPCGLRGKRVTSFKHLLGTVPSIDQVQERVIVHSGALLEREIYRAPASVVRSSGWQEAVG